MIKEFKNLEKVEDIVKEAHFRRKDLDSDYFRRHLIDAMVSGGSYIKVDLLGDEVVGFMFATIQEYIGRPVAFIQEAFTTEKGKTSLRRLIEDLEVWAKENELEGIYFMTFRDPKAWIRKYKFEKKATIMTRRI